MRSSMSDTSSTTMAAVLNEMEHRLPKRRDRDPERLKASERWPRVPGVRRQRRFTQHVFSVLRSSLPRLTHFMLMCLCMRILEGQPRHIELKACKD